LEYNFWSGVPIKKMEKIIQICFLIFTTSIVLLSGCQSTPKTPAGQSADDIVITPGGYAYRGNIQQQGVTNPFPPVQTVDVVLNTAENIILTYRANIQTKAGETRNNILGLSGTGIQSKMGQTVTFTPMNLPSGITSNPAQTNISPRTSTYTAIKISSQIKPGKYTFEISVTINGIDYGKVPCEIDVTT
jgi:hypothetical protein